MSKKRIFSCPGCGNPHEANPPDDLHSTVSLEEPRGEAEGSVIKIVHDCKECKRAR